MEVNPLMMLPAHQALFANFVDIGRPLTGTLSELARAGYKFPFIVEASDSHKQYIMLGAAGNTSSSHSMNPDHNWIIPREHELYNFSLFEKLNFLIRNNHGR